MVTHSDTVETERRVRMRRRRLGGGADRRRFSAGLEALIAERLGSPVVGDVCLLIQ